jgi:ubiquinone/menaquinone biosynthesis C-methylase UbiE
VGKGGHLHAAAVILVAHRGAAFAHPTISIVTNHPQDPVPPRWAEVELPDAWTDREASGARGAWRLLRHALGRRRARVELPAGLLLAAEVPRYALQEFHNIPNGNYSNRLTRGYATGFDLAMLGRMRPARRRMAAALADCRSVLDVGCGGGASTEALVAAGIDEVWGLDPSPYLLRCADARVPRARFVQGVAERTGFAAERFDGIACCFVFHELPPRAADQALAELARISRPRARLAIVEPAAEQYQTGAWRLIARHGPLGAYFRLLARRIHEPFAAAWHARDARAWLAEHGFAVSTDRVDFPVRTLVAERTAR